MRTAHYGSIMAVLTALHCALPAHGQDVCRDDETVGRCHARLFSAAMSAGRPAAAQATAAEADELKKKATGPHVAENLAQSAIRDFLPRFAGTLLASDPTDDLQALDFRFNAPMAQRGAGGFTLQGGVTLHKAEVYAPLVDSVPESIRSATRTRMEGELEDGDDATAFAALNLENRRLGRNFASHQTFVDRIAAAFEDSANTVLGSNRQETTRRFAAFVGSRLSDLQSIDPQRQDDPACVDVTRNPVIPRQHGRLPVPCLTAEVRAELESIMGPFTRAQARRELTVESLLSDAGFEFVADLVNNQPQLNFSAEYRSRVTAVGPNEWAGRMRFETGFANMNGLRRHCGSADAASGRDTARDTESARETAGRQDSVLLACLREYTGSSAVRRSLARSDRLWVEGQVRYRPEYHVAFPSDSVEFTLGSGVGFGVSGGYGRYLGSADATSEDRDRIDLHVSYDHADGEDLRQSRFLAGVFYTLRISGSASGVVGLAWANKPEFLEGADRRLHANLGLSYKFNTGKNGN